MRTEDENTGLGFSSSNDQLFKPSYPCLVNHCLFIYAGVVQPSSQPLEIVMLFHTSMHTPVFPMREVSTLVGSLTTSLRIHRPGWVGRNVLYEDGNIL